MDVTRDPVRSKAVNYYLLFRQVHKWLALFVGLQLLLWTISGFIMSYRPIEEVHGDHLWNKSARPAPVNSRDVSFETTDLLAGYAGQEVENIRLFSRSGQAVYEVRLGEKTVYLDAKSGADLAPVTEQQAIGIAKNAYRWHGQYQSIEYVTDPEQYSEIRGRPLPVWKVNFADDIATSLYVSPDTGRVITVRSDIWRQYDFFWMLHIMDYEARENFNNALLIFATSVALFIAFSGVLLIFYSFGKRDFRWLRR